MLPEFAQQLEINVHSGATPDHDEIHATIRSEMKDCDIHAWFDVFERVLCAAGFHEESIMKGACKLAFNEFRSPDKMRRVATEYDLTLNEHLPDYPFSGPVTTPLAGVTSITPLHDN
jgi:hypothetical protein